MLLPSALACDVLSSPRPRLQPSLFSSPPSSPPSAQQTIFATCRALQSMLSAPSTAPSQVPPSQQAAAYPRAQLPTPPMANADLPAANANANATAFKLRLRARKPADGERRSKITKRTSAASAAPRSKQKRRRAVDDDMGRDEEDDETDQSDNDGAVHDEELPALTTAPVFDEPIAQPSTPKRSRSLAPPVLPLGLDRADFRQLHADELLLSDATSQGAMMSAAATNPSHPLADLEWTTEDDRMLVELVLEKLKLSRSEWTDCARTLGRDRASVGRRWRSLMGSGEVGLKRRRLHATWR